jgi:hypothetical protein
VAIAVLACGFGVMCYVESTTLLETQIALGADPFEVSAWVSMAIFGALAFLVLLAVRLRRSLLVQGELRLVGSSLILKRESTYTTRDLAELRSATSYPAGANMSLLFSERVRLPGQWLPPGWKRTWRGWVAPDGTRARLRRKTHPLVLALCARKPDLKVGLAGVPAEVAACLLLALLPRVGTAPLYLEARKLATRANITDTANVQFQEGRYLEACDTYRRASSALRNDDYGSQWAAEFLLYCGESKLAVQAFVGFETQFLWPGQLDPDGLARIRISRGQYRQAEGLLHGQPSYLLYVTLAEQGKTDQADQVLHEIAKRDGLARVLLLRHSGDARTAQVAEDELCTTFRGHKPWTPSWLARVFESCILAGGMESVKQDPRFESAIRSLPGLRAELTAFTAREAPGYLQSVKAAMERYEQPN